MGYKADYLENSNSRFSIYNNFLYFQYNWKKSELLDFYANLGLGGAIIHYEYRDKAVSGTDPGAYLELGWSGLKIGKTFFRFGIMSIYLHEDRGLTGFAGAAFSVGLQL